MEPMGNPAIFRKPILCKYTMRQFRNWVQAWGRWGWGFTGLLKPRRKKYKLVFHKGSIKKKVLEYGTPKPSLQGLEIVRFATESYKLLRLQVRLEVHEMPPVFEST